MVDTVEETTELDIFLQKFQAIVKEHNDNLKIFIYVSQENSPVTAVAGNYCRACAATEVTAALMSGQLKHDKLTNEAEDILTHRRPQGNPNSN